MSSKRIRHEVYTLSQVLIFEASHGGLFRKLVLKSLGNVGKFRKKKNTSSSLIK